ncbi:TniB family NTP-binding protein, partial [Caedibacter taeniospiralis]|uniref:TniB family NTP-binding protein n=1 Tax=Caedibacter taeniospiralis TaxID=28907 RepID=UPI0037BFF63C
YSALLSTTGAPVIYKSRLADLEQQTLRILQKIDLKILIIDEIHNILSGRNSLQREFLNLLRYLGNELRISLVSVGTREAYLAIQSDSQLENRFEPMVLPRWQANQESCSLLASFAASFPLQKPSHISSLEMTQYCLSRTEGTIGELSALLTSAAIVAVKTGEESINENTLKISSYMGPTMRRRQFERDVL